MTEILQYTQNQSSRKLYLSVLMESMHGRKIICYRLSDVTAIVQLLRWIVPTELNLQITTPHPHFVEECSNSDNYPSP